MKFTRLFIGADDDTVLESWLRQSKPVANPLPQRRAPKGFVAEHWRGMLFAACFVIFTLAFFWLWGVIG